MKLSILTTVFQNKRSENRDLVVKNLSFNLPKFSRQAELGVLILILIYGLPFVE